MRVLRNLLGCRLGDRQRFSRTIFQRSTAQKQPLPDSFGGARAEALGRCAVLVGPAQPVHLRHPQPVRIYSTAQGDETRNSPRHNTIGAPERGQREKFAVRDSGQHRCGGRTSAVDQSGKQVQSCGYIRPSERAAQSGIVDQIGCRQRMQPGQCLEWCALPDAHQWGGAGLQSVAGTKRPGEHRVVGHGIEGHATAIQCRRTPRAANRRLRGRHPPFAQIRPVPVRLTQCTAGRFGGVGHAGQRQQWREWISGAHDRPR